MRGRVTQALQAVDFGERLDQAGQRPTRAVGAFAVIGVDVLAEQGEFAHAAFNQFARLVEQRRDRPGILHAPRVRDDTECAELVTAFLDGQEGRRRAAAAAGRQLLELVALGEVELDDLAALDLGVEQQARQVVVGLRADHEVDDGSAVDDLLAFGLGNATSDRDRRAEARRLAIGLDATDATELRIDLLGGLFANVASIQNHKVRVLESRRFLEPDRRQRLDDALAVIDIHLTAKRLDENLLRPHLALTEAGRGRQIRIVQHAGHSTQTPIKEMVTAVGKVCLLNSMVTGLSPNCCNAKRFIAGRCIWARFGWCSRTSRGYGKRRSSAWRVTRTTRRPNAIAIPGFSPVAPGFLRPRP